MYKLLKNGFLHISNKPFWLIFFGGDILYVNEESKIGYYAVIPSTVLFNEELKSNEKLLYAVITAWQIKKDIVMHQITI